MGAVMKEIISKTTLEKIFVILALFFGLLYVFILPPFQSVDEGNHFFRTYQISEGNFISKNISEGASSNNNDNIGDYLPVSLADFAEYYQAFIKDIDKKQNISNIRRDLSLQVNPEQRQFIAFKNTSLYSPVCYITQLPGVILGKLLTNHLAVIYYLGRISNLLFYCLIVYFAIKIIPFYKLPLLLLALMPMSLSLGASYTCDVSVIGLNFLWVALILKIISNKDGNVGCRGFVIGLVVLAFVLSLTKSYIWLYPLIFLIPINIFKNIKSYILFLSTVILVVGVGGTLSYLSIKGLTLNMNNDVADSSAQLLFILTHPFAYFIVLVKTFIIKITRILITMIGVLGWQDTRLDWSTYILYPILLYIALYSDNFKFKLYKWQNYIVISTVILGFIGICTCVYIIWNSVGNNIILGLNGKYFIPLMLPLFLLFKNKLPKYDYNKVLPLIIAAVILILFTSELSLLHRFYDLTPNLYYKV